MSTGQELPARLSGQDAVVTGGSRGIGFAIGKALAALGAAVALVSRSETDLQTAVAEITRGGGVAVGLPADVTDPDAVEQLATRARGTLGPIDLLVSAAGTKRAVGPDWELEPQVWWDDMAVNLARRVSLRPCRTAR